MSKLTTNDPPPGKNNPPPGGLEELIAEAEELRRLLQEGVGRLSHLISALKQQRKQSRVFREAVASIQKLTLES